MPFGLVFGAVFFLVVFVLRLFRVLALVFTGGEVPFSPWFLLAETSLALLMLGLALGLFLRQNWARWTGVAVGILLTVMFGLLTWQIGTVDAMLVFFCSILTVVLLLLPATGSVSRGGQEGMVRRTRFGEILGYSVAGTLVAFIVCYGLAAYRIGPETTDGAQQELNISRVAWSDFGTGLQRASVESKPVLIDFFAEWCGPCKAMDRNTFRNPEVMDILNRVVPVRVDAEGTTSIEGFRGEDLANRFRVASYPTLVLLDSRGSEIGRSTGFKTPGALLNWMEGVLKRAGVTLDAPGPEVTVVL